MAATGILVTLVGGACSPAVGDGKAAQVAQATALVVPPGTLAPSFGGAGSAPSASLTIAAPSAPALSSDPAPAAIPAPSGQVEGAQGTPGYTIEQAISDKAQSTTIAFDALGFLTGNINSDSFFPPGKVADFWGFQYLRDNDPTGLGHNTDFLTKVSLNTLNILSSAQRARLVTLAKSQAGLVQTYALDRFTLMSAFRRDLAGTLPAGTTELSEPAVRAYSASLYQLDGAISLARAKVMGSILAGLTSAQRTELAALKGRGVANWPTAAEPAELRGLERAVKELVMAYSGDLYSWYAGSVTADTYFCPERHGTYFGSFYLKDAPAVGNPGYSIDTTLTANLGTALLGALSPTHASAISSLVDSQRPTLMEIVTVRKAISTRLRALQAGGTVDATQIAALMTTYGRLDGELVYQYATAFVKVGQSLTPGERTALEALRSKVLGTLSLPSRPYLYSTAIAMPSIPSTDFLFK
jgi:hypothetical protein